MTSWQPMKLAPINEKVLVAYPRFNRDNKTNVPDEYTVFVAERDELGWDTGFWRLHETPVAWMKLPVYSDGEFEKEDK